MPDHPRSFPRERKKLRQSFQRLGPRVMPHSFSLEPFRSLGFWRKNWGTSVEEIGVPPMETPLKAHKTGGRRRPSALALVLVKKLSL